MVRILEQTWLINQIRVPKRDWGLVHLENPRERGRPYSSHRYSRSPTVGNPTNSILESNVQGIPQNPDFQLLGVYSVLSWNEHS